MINEKEEFACYTGQVCYTARNKNDRNWLGRFTFDMLKEFEGMARVLTILARGYLWERGEPDPDYARRALCAWCSTPERKNAGSVNKSWREKCSFPEYHEEFPQLVDEKGAGWLYRHVKKLCAFAKKNPGLVDAYAAADCEILRKNFTKRLRAKLVHYQVPLFSPTTEKAWSLCFDSVLADALELGPLRDGADILTEDEEKMIVALAPPDVPLEMLRMLIAYYRANKPRDSVWVVLPVTNFDAYFGSSSFSRKYLNKIPKGLIQRGKQSYGICRYKVNMGVLQTPINLVYSEDGTPMPRDELYQALGLDMVDW